MAAAFAGQGQVGVRLSSCVPADGASPASRALESCWVQSARVLRRRRRTLLPCSVVAFVAGASLAARSMSCHIGAAVPPPVGGGAAGACEVVVVRHGETDWNRQLRVQGSTDIELNDRGHAQARSCAKLLGEEFAGERVPASIYSSVLARASATADAIADAINAAHSNGSSRCRVQRDRRLQEWQLGSIEGLRKDEAARLHAADWAIFSQWCAGYASEEDASTAITGGGESMEEVRLRAVHCLEEACQDEVARSPGAAGLRPVIAVTHGGVLGQLLRHAAAQEEQAAGQAKTWRPAAANACISRFLVNPTTGVWRILSWADTAHLGNELQPMTANYDGKGEETGDVAK
eukprot:TRINITY_DN40822_c0_g1_i1.p1 TRINITY_DN40822_c0_g1~~TRINITY_DN40822_c0_g1_i1.p1  ORF type:complete len:348 (-),score=74.02 TRINITY_DN40822_c0_g1_i1:205-1248(-)